MDKLKTLFLKNTGLKIISLFVAILLWIVSMNVNNPQMTQTYKVPITLLNLNHVNESGMVVLNEADITKQQAYVLIKATRNDLLALDQSRITATVDFSPVDVTNKENIGKTVPVAVHVSVPSINYEIVDSSPRTIDISFDELTTKDIPIGIVKSGAPSSNYEVVGEPTVSPNFVTIKGPKTYVDNVNRAEVYVNMDNTSESINGQYKVNIIDNKETNVTEKFSLSSQSANVNIGVEKTDNLMIGTPSWEGEPATEYRVTDVTWSPKYVDVIGNEDTISSIAYIELPKINVAGANGNVTQVFDLNEILKTYGISLQNGSESQCTVTVVVEQVVIKIIELPTDEIVFTNFTESEKAQFEMPDTFQVTIIGPESVVANVEPSMFSYTADFSSYTEGNSDIEVDVTCTDTSISVESPVRLRISDKR